MDYQRVLDKLHVNPLNAGKTETKEYLREVFEFHMTNTPYWKRVISAARLDLDELFQGTLEEVFERIFNSGLAVDEEYLRHNWLEFIPNNYSGRIRFYQSSGTTRERAIGHWDRDYLKALHMYLRESLDEIYSLAEIYNEEHQMKALAHGPYGWYQDEISELVWSYGGVLYFIGMETDGLKKVYAKQGLEAVLKILDPLVRYTKRVMEKDTINTVRSAPPLMALFEPYHENIETTIISGVGINYEFFQHLSEKFENATLIPLYGYYAFGDLVGIQKGRSFWYYPNYPFTIIFPLKQEDGYKIVKHGERGQVGMIIARPEVLIVKLEDETAIRTPADGPFRWDGFGDPKRRVG
ncbi:hypothetical protein [Thermococcus piezophilus]|uniref:Acyl-protein synthetase LuxE domain-containing protein n=1 Tax=Thermococcus piezophilus TaxID=1712654 RepID=A0A172WJ66_9EURY|nr:hypothetical protein [Thermococcus piezophilus]ANF23389.1 hypothetical protein A7C91_09590 [Thermococcus piezophilus]